MVRVYGMSSSGNCYKVKLLLTQLAEPFDWVETDTLKGETRRPEFLAKNPNGKVPLLEADGRYLMESNAILCYLAEGSVYFPAGRWPRAEVLQWMFYEQYSHEPYIATARFIRKFLKNPDEPTLPLKTERGYAALALMERHLGTHEFFACETYTIADIALYAYTHVAADGGFDLGGFPAINAWLVRVRSQPRHIPIG
ncbi:MAG TPA: glutathione S-transferase family protein [Gammaproteobacteria bacterium]|nr:glutathione S-transferase family protein [Gammaproteobacteria bacterium]